MGWVNTDPQVRMQGGAAEAIEHTHGHCICCTPLHSISETVPAVHLRTRVNSWRSDQMWESQLADFIWKGWSLTTEAPALAFASGTLMAAGLKGYTYTPLAWNPAMMLEGEIAFTQACQKRTLKWIFIMTLPGFSWKNLWQTLDHGDFWVVLGGKQSIIIPCSFAKCTDCGS